MEEWKQIKGFEDKYEVSSLGRIRNKKTDNILKGGLNQDGYHRVTLNKEGIGQTVFIHRLVAQSFIPNLENKPQVNHISGIKTNNCISNLEWCTHDENMQHANTNSLIPVGSKHHASKFTEEDVLHIIKLKQEGASAKELAKLYNVSHGHIHKLVRGFQWKHIKR